MTNKPKITISTSPFLHDQATTPKIMWELGYTLIPVLLAAIYYFGLSALLVSLASIAGCLVTEYYLGNKGPLGSPLRDGSALVTGLLLALTLPPGFPLWMAFVGGVVAIGMGKAIWGGLGQNVFNPALVGRAFLQAAFPTAITTWEPPDGRYWGARGTNLAMPFYQGEPVDALSTATPLSEMKFSHEPTALADLLLGNISGSLGETCAVLLILAGLYLVIRRIINWRIPVAILATVALFSGIAYLLAPDRYPSPGFMVLAGGLLLGTVYMATDPVSSPLTPKGIWIYGVGIGLLVVLIRIWGGLPEGVMYAILLMNAATPLINRFARTRVYGYS
ncbi:MAG: RnfABCDGE type electron transport complex subunit D [Lewinellaceae bacterium]|nr:RnfABCDGE type electron transport complex subunit D [Phaeodactylibacter sp.]MCB0612111.1 RnfABCDGE type electron transport complex subunit D [Phaeodactylibacter sp.]MCB9351259.1 RnfABCDGE type electron transport complex subunit D [Lewinellaceae bacterium]